ncbi:MAG: hypothetical protein IPG56_20375 [Caulobacteraceae bacterium]|nr:hypothetical protein [Caulobacteraceae bacterium]
MKHSTAVNKPSSALRNATGLTSDEFVSAVIGSLPKRIKLSGSEISDLKREHAATIEPARLARAEIFALEHKLSNLINGAYGLTPEDVALMWRTAPPRMPFTPAGLQEVELQGEDAGDEEGE